MFGIIGFVARVALVVLIIWGIVKLIEAIKPRARHFTTTLQYPNREQIALVEEGESLLLSAEPGRHKIFAFRTSKADDDGYLGEVPAKYFRSIEPVLRTGDDYHAVVTRRTRNNVHVEFFLGTKELPEEFV